MTLWPQRSALGPTSRSAQPSSLPSHHIARPPGLPRRRIALPPSLPSSGRLTPWLTLIIVLGQIHRRGGEEFQNLQK